MGGRRVVEGRAGLSFVNQSIASVSLLWVKTWCQKVRAFIDGIEIFESLSPLEALEALENCGLC